MPYKLLCQVLSPAFIMEVPLGYRAGLPPRAAAQGPSGCVCTPLGELHTPCCFSCHSDHLQTLPCCFFYFLPATPTKARAHIRIYLNRYRQISLQKGKSNSHSYHKYECQLSSILTGIDIISAKLIAKNGISTFTSKGQHLSLFLLFVLSFL